MNNNYITLAKCASKIKKINKSSDQVTKDAISNELFDLFIREKGLFLKLGQFISQHKKSANYIDKTVISINEIDKESKKLLEDSLSKYSYSLLEEVIHLGSIGFAIKVKNQNNETKCLKIQYPSIKNNLLKQFKALNNIEKLAPSFISKDSSLKDLLQGLKENIANELDYKNEVENTQIYARNIESKRISTCCPKLINNEIIEMNWIDGTNLNSSENLLKSQKEEASRLLIYNFHHTLFNKGFIQVDNQEDNYSFNTIENSLTVLDLGNCITVEKKVRSAILRMILSIQKQEDINYISLLTDIGFNRQKLEEIEELIPPLLEAIFAPYCSQYKYNLENYNINQLVDNILGEKKWWFRSAGNEQVFSLMRSFSLLIKTISNLEIPIFYKSCLLEDVYQDFFKESELLSVESSHSDYFKAMSKNLTIQVIENNKEKVFLTLPSKALKEVESYISPEVKESIKSSKINLKEVVNRAYKNKLRPMTVLELDYGNKKISIHLSN